MAGTQEVDAKVFAAAEQIARGLLLFGRNVDRGERVRAVEDRQLGRIATIGFDAIPGAPGNQRGRDDVTRDVVGGERTLQLEATRTGFVAALDGAGAPKTLDEAKKRRDVRA